MDNNFRKFFISVIMASIIVSSFFGAVMGYWAANANNGQFSFNKPANPGNNQTVIQATDGERAIIGAVDRVSPAVVSIIISKNLPKIQRYNNNPFGSDLFQQFFDSDFPEFFGPGQGQTDQPSGQDSGGTVKQEIGGGTGFIITPDGFIVTNNHVIIDAQADYTVLMNDGKKYAAKVIGQDPAVDLAFLKISATNLPTVELGDSSNLKVGQSVIAIGNALGEFRNTVSTGVVSGLARSVTAGGVGFGSEELANVIQTDASINPGNSGGPLLNISGQVIGINTAIAQGAQNIGFAIPINEVKNAIDSIKQNGRIIRPWLGVRYVVINQAIADANKLSVNYGAIIVHGQDQSDLAVIPGSPADKAGLVENDIILELNGKKINETNPLANVLSKFKPGDQVTLKVLHQGKQKTVKVTLAEMK